MEVKTQDLENGVRINIETDHKVALVVYSEEGERIYLPDGSGSNSTYYVENSSGLVETETGYSVAHEGKVDDLTVLS